MKTEQGPGLESFLLLIALNVIVYLGRKEVHRLGVNIPRRDVYQLIDLPRNVG